MTSLSLDPNARARTPAAPAVRLTGVRARPLDVGEVIAAVSDPAAGGLDVFIGMVRDHDQSRPVVALEYEAHPSAADRLARLAAEIAADLGDVALAAVHRTGSLRIGEEAVVVAASAAHRDRAFLACRTLIDRLKHEVPIWKAQVFADGTQEWVGTC